MRWGLSKRVEEIDQAALSFEDRTLKRFREIEERLKKLERRDCSFCGKGSHEVSKLIAGPGSVFICNECVAICLDVLASPKGEA